MIGLLDRRNLLRRMEQAGQAYHAENDDDEAWAMHLLVLQRDRLLNADEAVGLPVAGVVATTEAAEAPAAGAAPSTATEEEELLALVTSEGSQRPGDVASRDARRSDDGDDDQQGRRSEPQ